MIKKIEQFFKKLFYKKIINPKENKNPWVFYVWKLQLEVKASENINNVSLTRFNESNENKISIRFSARNLDKSGKILNIPIFMAEYVDKLIQIGME